MRRAIAVSTVLLCLTACGSGPQKTDRTRDSGSAAETTQQATDRVRAAFELMERTSFGYRNTANDGSTVIDGVVHRPSASTTMKMAITTDDDVTSVTEFVRIGDHGWGRLDLVVKGGTTGVAKWKVLPADVLAQDPFRRVAGGAFLVSADLFSGVAGLHETGPQTYAGTIDLTPHPYLGLMDESVVSGLGEQAAKIPMTVTLDAAGRLTSFVVDVPGHPMEITFTDFDAVTQPAPPAD
jgi:hypothetical protein